MEIKFSQWNKRLLKLVREIGTAADRRSLKAFLVGGFVRDLFLKRNNLDLDVVIEGDAISFARVMAKKLNAKLTTYDQFKTATLLLPSGLHFDLATARKETYPFSGALPVVKSASIKQDLFRRDFTINAMAVAINRDCFGRLVDEFGGFSDLINKKIRVLHDKSFIDDPTRILRAVRFEQRFYFRIEPHTLSLLRRALDNRADSRVKPPRYFAEFKKILKEENSFLALGRLNGLKGLNFISGQPLWDKSSLKLFCGVQGELKWFQRRFPFRSNAQAWIAYLTALLKNLSFNETKGILEKFQLSREDSEKILFGTFALKMLRKLSQKNLPPHQIYNLLKPSNYETLIFLRALAKQGLVKTRIENYLTRFESVRLSISGEDLKNLGVEPSKKIGYILEEILNRKIDGIITSRREELKCAQNLI